MTSLLIVDDHRLLTQALRIALQAEGFDVLVADEPDHDLVLALTRVHRPDLVLLDLMLGADRHGAALIAPLAQLTAVLVLTGTTDRAALGRCLELGAIGVTSKADPFDRLLERIQAAASGGRVLSVSDREDLLAAHVEHRLAEHKRLSAFRSLSPREREVLGYVANGMSADAIAERTYVSVPTIRTHIQAIFRKLDVNSQVAAVARVHEAGWSLDTSLN